MKNLIKSMIIAFSMYSNIPMPKVSWEKDNLKYSFIFFPFIGLIIGVLLNISLYFANAYQFNAVLFGAACIFINIIITGGIHMDGFCDVMDALSSHKDKEEKLHIMKDPNVGAFAVIYTALLLIVQLGIFVQLYYSPKYIAAVILIFAISRILSGLSIILFFCAKSSGLAAIFANGASKKPVIIALIFMLVLSFSAMIYSYMYFGIVLLLCAALLFLWFAIFTKRIFGGITGDLAGYFLNVFETVMLAVIVIAGGIL